MNKSSQYNQQQTEPNSASLKLRNYVFTKTWKLAIAISENKYKKIVGTNRRGDSMLERISARENFSGETIYI